MAISVGEKAPDFTLPSSDGQNVGEVSLSDYAEQENIVLAFFPFAFASICKAEMCEFKDQMATFNQLKARVFGISVDGPYSLNAFSQAEGLNFELLSDFNKETASNYGVLYETLGSFKGVAKRSVFVIDKNSTIRYQWATDDPRNLPDLNEITQTLEAL